MRIQLTTIQRRLRNLIFNNVIIIKSDINYEKFGFTMVLLHTYFEDGSINEVAHQINESKELNQLKFTQVTLI